MKDKLVQLMDIVQADPAVQSVAGYTGAGSGGGSSQTNTGSVYVLLKPLVGAQDLVGRGDRASASAARAGSRRARLFLQTVQDIRVGARQSNAQFQFTLQADQVTRSERMGAEARSRRCRRAR